MKKSVFFVAGLFLIVAAVVCAVFLIYYFVCGSEPQLTFIGHASVKITSSKGLVIYIDPSYVNGDYSAPADYILVTHNHTDHNVVSLCTQKPDCKVILYTDVLSGGVYKTLEENGVRIQAVPAGGNPTHGIQYGVGYIVTVDGISVYHAGDTSMNDGLKTINGAAIDYALYPVDGRYNMGPAEATRVADMIGAACNIPIHGNGERFPAQCKEFAAKNKLILVPGQTIPLKPRITAAHTK